METMEIAFQIIMNAGNAKSCFMEAINASKKGNFTEAEEKITEGSTALIEAHKVHANLIQEEAKGNRIDIDLMFMHAEDQLLSTETIKIMAQEFVELYQNLAK